MQCTLKQPTSQWETVGFGWSWRLSMLFGLENVVTSNVVTMEKDIQRLVPSSWYLQPQIASTLVPFTLLYRLPNPAPIL